jgi:DNA-binding NtrC family response regulator
VLLHEGPTITPEHLGLSRGSSTAPVEVSADGVRVDFSAGGIQLENVERHLIREALQAAAWKRGRAAKLLGITKETLRYRMEKYQLHPPA